MTDSGSRSRRLTSIDVLRGLVIVLMVVDHTREYSIGPVPITDPMQLPETPPFLFWMRWVTHFCAPVFTLLAGVSAGLTATAPDPSGRQPWSWHHVTRGLVLVLMEVTVVHYAWTFSWVWPMHYLQVIWGIGLSLVMLGLLQRVPRSLRVTLGVLCVAGHNLLDAVHVTSPPLLQWLWAILHDRQVLPLWGDLTVRTSYPILPMIGLVLIGEGVGRWFAEADRAERVRRLTQAGVLAIGLFILLRGTNAYGDLHPAVYGVDWGDNLRRALNTTKYPMSLSFLLMTLGPASLCWAALEHRDRVWTAPLERFGQVPMFLYLAHLYLLHAGALVWALLSGVPWSALDFRATITGLPPGFGFAPWVTLPIVGGLLLVLYPAAGWYAAVRGTKRYPITRYL